MKKTMLLALLSLCFVWTAMAQNGIYDITVKDAEGKEVLLKEYEGKVLLIVNTATRCGFTPQYEALEKLYEQYKGQGFVVLDFPCNQFGEQAPGTIEEIKDFCTLKYGTKFPLFEKIEVNGENESPLYTYLKSQKGFEGFTGSRAHAMSALLEKKDKDYASKPDIKWNFTKFLIDKQGNVVARFEPTAGMDEVEKAVQALL
ncbi:glutathione peroxidase [Tannerella sp.]|uniref:glutathione peroxidase n=1 Tax=Tannerella sp. TaxID=2382127 RepID=UPI003FA1C766